MRKTFDNQLQLGRPTFDDIKIKPNSKYPLDQLIFALIKLYQNKEYFGKVLDILDKKLFKNDKTTGRPGLDAWTIFVLAQIRMCLDLDYNAVHNLANKHADVRILIGAEINKDFGIMKSKEFEYQQIFDNISLLSDELLREINDIIVQFGHNEVFKKKRNGRIVLKNG